MISNELREAADKLERLISEEREKQSAPNAFHSQIRSICADLLEAAKVDGLGGCPLCQG